jgi:hypothetical protein
MLAEDTALETVTVHPLRRSIESDSAPAGAFPLWKAAFEVELRKRNLTAVSG